MTSVIEKSVMAFSVLLVVITLEVVTGCGDKPQPEPTLSDLASISPVHGYSDYQTFVGKENDYSGK